MGLVGCGKGFRAHRKEHEATMVSKGKSENSQKPSTRKNAKKAAKQPGSKKAGSLKTGNSASIYALTTAEKVNMLVRRGVAASFDLFFLYMPAGVAGWLLLAFGIIVADKMGWGTPTDTINQLTPWAVGFWVLGSILAESVSTSKWGTTPGKRIVGLSVAQRSGEKPNLMKMVERATLKHMPFWVAAMVWPPLVIIVAGIWFVYWVRSGQMIHDRIARTTLKNRI